MKPTRKGFPVHNANCLIERIFAFVYSKYEKRSEKAKNECYANVSKTPDPEKINFFNFYFYFAKLFIHCLIGIILVSD